jgi:hypothetical protein
MKRRCLRLGSEYRRTAVRRRIRMFRNMWTCAAIMAGIPCRCKILPGSHLAERMLTSLRRCPNDIVIQYRPLYSM